MTEEFDSKLTELCELYNLAEDYSERDNLMNQICEMIGDVNPLKVKVTFERDFEVPDDMDWLANEIASGKTLHDIMVEEAINDTEYDIDNGEIQRYKYNVKISIENENGEEEYEANY